MAEKKPKAAAKKAAKPAAKRAPQERPRPRPEAASVDVVNVENKKVGDRLVSPEVFGVPVNDHLLYEAVKQYRAGGRRGTHMTKNRALVSGSGKKPWRQKGTGRARVGETRNPLWRHGGTVFGPMPRDYSYTHAQEGARRGAALGALPARCTRARSRWSTRFPRRWRRRPRPLKGILDALGVAGKTVIVDHEPTDALVLSGRNIPGLRVVDDSHLTVYDVLDCKNLLVSQEALGKLEERLTP